VDTQGFPHATAVTTADVTDRSGALQAMERCAGNLEQVRGVLVDGGYSGAPFADAVQEKLGAKVQVVKRNELHTFTVIPQRWIVEHSFGWLEQSRRLWKNPRTSAQYQLAIHTSGLLEPLAEKIVDSLSEKRHS
jgi:transposase